MRNPDQRYVIQYRNPIYAIVSHYRLEVDAGRISHSRLSWSRFFRKDLKFYRRFVEKWLPADRPTNIHPLLYEGLLTDPAHHLSELLAFYDPSRAIDTAWLAEVVKSENIKPRSRISEFEFYDLEKFCEALVSIKDSQAHLPVRAWLKGLKTQQILCVGTEGAQKYQLCD